jgi:photosystem II stability/assembly factor-like uncharacterized protein
MRPRQAILLVCIGIFIAFPPRGNAQWEKVGSPKGGWITSLLSSGPNLYAGTRKGGGVYMSMDSGVTWKKSGKNFPANADVQCLAALGANIFAGTVKNGVILSPDNGTNWAPANAGMPSKTPSVFRLQTVRTKVYATVSPDGHAALFVSTDNGASWNAAHGGMPDTNVFCIAAIGASLFVGAGVPLQLKKPGGVFVSVDDGTSWRRTGKGIPEDEAIVCLAVCGENLFAGTWRGGRVFWSMDNGASWTKASSGLPGAALFSLSALLARGSDLFLGSFQGVYLTRDNGTSWTPINQGFPDEPNIYCLAANDAYLFGGTEDGQVWRLPLKDLPAK